MGTTRVAVIGAGIGGLVAGLELAARGLDVTIVERAATPGGKMRRVEVGGSRIDAGPTVLTMRWVLEETFASAGGRLDAEVTLRPASILARHAWDADQRLDLHADMERSADAIGIFAGADAARGYRAFCAQARRIYETLDGPFIRAGRPSVPALVRGVGLGRLGDLWSIRPFDTLWRALGEHFADPRLRQLFGRYATYCGSSPFNAPATLMLVAHVEQSGVWLVEGGMQRIAEALAALAAHNGATLRYRAEAAQITTGPRGVDGVLLADGERLAADAVVVNADVAAVADGLLGRAVAKAVSPPRAASRSLSALTWAMSAGTAGFPLVRHNVFFSSDYAAEFDDILVRRRLPSAPTVYVCAQDRGDAGDPLAGPERLLCLVNAPATGDSDPFDAAEIEPCTQRAFALLERCGLHIARRPEATRVTTPRDFDRLFPGTGGALYGQASHGWRASFERPGARTRVAGLYLAGGSTHPGPGVPMAALSGRLAAQSLLEDLASTRRSRRTAMSGGISMR